MAQSEQLPKPSRLRTPTFRQIETLSSRIGFVPALSSLMAENNFNISITGDLPALKAHEGGILFVGDHRHRWEFLPLMRLLDELNRPDIQHFAMFYLRRAVAAAIGPTVANHIISAYPGYIAKGNPIFGRKPLERLMFRNHLKTRLESKELNASALQSATSHLAAGGSLNIYPCGRDDSWTGNWRTGIGTILNNLSEEAREATLIVPYATGHINQAHLVAAFAARGLMGGPDITLQLGDTYPASNVLSSGATDAADITKQVRKRFIADPDLR